jgi:hypothetical protein
MMFRQCTGVRKRGAQLLLGTLTGVVLIAACTREKATPVLLPSSKTWETPAAKDSPATEQIASSDAQTAQRELELSDNGVFGRQRKTLDELRSSIVNCVGAGRAQYDMNDTGADADPLNAPFPPIFTVNQRMALGQEPLAGRQTFLVTQNPSGLNGKNILDLQASFLQVSGSSLTVRATALEDEMFLNALQTVAFVVAFNCDVSEGNTRTPQCVCSTPVAARSMLERCLPLLDPTTEQFDQAVKALADTENCGSLDTYKRRRAIASLLSSYAFATSR